MASLRNAQPKMRRLIFCLHSFLLSIHLFTFHVCSKIKPGQHNLLGPAKTHTTTSTQLTDLPLNLDPPTIWTLWPAQWPAINDIVVRILFTGGGFASSRGSSPITKCIYCALLHLGAFPQYWTWDELGKINLEG